MRRISKSLVAYSAMFAVALTFTASEITYDSHSNDLEVGFADAEARGGSRGGGSFRSSGSRSRSSLKSYKSKSKTTRTKASKPKAKAKAVAKKPAKPTPKQVAATKRKQKETSSKKALQANQAKYKTKAKPASATELNANRKSIASNTRGHDSSTRSTRRNDYYNSYHAPSYAYYGRSSYGVFDTIVLYSLLSGHNSHMMAYNYHGNPGYMGWRSQANIQARENAELRAQLAAMDAKVNAIAVGTPRNTSYVPEGVDGDLLYSEEALANVKPLLRVCTGQTNGTYIKFGTSYGDISSVNVQVVKTNGSADNLRRVEAGECDAALVQRDAFFAHLESSKTTKLDMQRIDTPYNESLHMLCNADIQTNSGWLFWKSTNVAKFTRGNTVYTGAEGSGTAVTWANFAVELTSDAYALATAKIASLIDERSGVSSDSESCMMRVGAVGSPIFKSLDAKTNNLRLVSLNDKDLLKVEDPEGKRVYSSAAIKGGTYDYLNPRTFLGMFGGNIDTVSVPVDVVVSNAWAKENGDVYDATVTSIRRTNASTVKALKLK